MCDGTGSDGIGPSGTAPAANDGQKTAIAEFSVRKVVKNYKTSGRRGPAVVKAVDGVSLEVKKGQRLGIVGESGSGKSTLVRMMDAIISCDGGEIYFRGQRIDNAKQRQLGELRASVQMVFQDPRSSLDPRMSVADIITEPLRSPLLRKRADVPPDHRARLAEVLSQVGLDADMCDHFPHEFSGGQRQRIAIARAIAPKPDVLIADEAVSALDVSVRAHVLNLFKDLVREHGLTLIFVSHDLSVVRHVCDTVAVIQAGRLIETGSVEQVYENPQAEYTKTLLASIPTLRLT